MPTMQRSWEFTKRNSKGAIMIEKKARTRDAATESKALRVWRIAWCGVTSERCTDRTEPNRTALGSCSTEGLAWT